MSSLHLVDPELRPILDIWPQMTPTPEGLAEARGWRFAMPPIDEAGVVLEQRAVPGPQGAPEIGLDLYRPECAAGPLPCIYHIHGGGYIMGAAKDFEGMIRPLVRALECVVVSVNYRLAPETVFPGAINDCYAGLAWTFANAASLGIDSERIGVMGESAGGGLAAALALMARDLGALRLAFQHLTYPMIDDRTCVRDPHPFAGEFIWPAAINHFGWASLLGSDPGGEGVSPYAAVARAEDLAGLPPTYISTGALDLFIDEDIDYARRLIRAGVPTELHVFPGAFHGYEVMPVKSAVAKATRAASRAALARFLQRKD